MLKGQLMRDSGKEHPLIRILTYLYSVLVALAIVAGLRFLLGEAPQANPDPTQIPWQAYLMFAALVVTIFPFFHGTMIHIAKTYRAGTDTSILTIAVDLLVLLSQGVMLHLMASTLGRGAGFMGWLIVLLLADVVFVITARLAAAGTTKAGPPWVWAWGNAVIVGGLLIVLLPPWPERVLGEFAPVIAFGLAGIRTLLDYGFAHRYYTEPIEGRG